MRPISRLRMKISQMYLNNLFRSTSIKQIAHLHLYVCVCVSLFLESIYLYVLVNDRIWFEQFDWQN